MFEARRFFSFFFSLAILQTQLSLATTTLANEQLKVLILRNEAFEIPSSSLASFSDALKAINTAHYAFKRASGPLQHEHLQLH